VRARARARKGTRMDKGRARANELTPNFILQCPLPVKKTLYRARINKHFLLHLALARSRVTLLRAHRILSYRLAPAPSMRQVSPPALAVGRGGNRYLVLVVVFPRRRTPSRHGVSSARVEESLSRHVHVPPGPLSQGRLRLHPLRGQSDQLHGQIHGVR